MEFRKAEKNSYLGEHSKQLKEARAGIQAADTVLEQVEILSLEFFFENSVARVHLRILHCYTDTLGQGSFSENTV